MDEPIDDQYFNWLYSQVSDAYPPALYQMSLVGQLFATEYYWLIEGDDNRYEDGIEMRREFLSETGVKPDPRFLNDGCSVLEMLIAFSRRAAWQTEESPRNWFWIMVGNLGLLDLSDLIENPNTQLKHILDVFLARTYGSNGSGGLFPLRHTPNNQRRVEIWYQLGEYLHELKNT